MNGAPRAIGRRQKAPLHPTSEHKANALKKSTNLSFISCVEPFLVLQINKPDPRANF
jgi:hypothetical protein